MVKGVLVVMYRPLFSSEDDLRYEGELMGKEKMLRTAIKAGISDVLLRVMVKDSGLGARQADCL